MVILNFCFSAQRMNYDCSPLLVFVPSLANRRLMLHIALVVAAVVLDGWFALMIFSLVFRGTGRTSGCGCLSIVVVSAVVATILAFRF